jgi:hypothetical protein
VATGQDREVRMSATEADLALMRRVRALARFVLLPLSLVMIGLKLAGWIQLSWVVVLLPGALYALHPIIIGALGPMLQHRRYRDSVESDRT